MKENRFLMDFNEVVKFINFLVENEVGFEMDVSKVIYNKVYHKLSIDCDIELNNGYYFWVEYYSGTWKVEVYKDDDMEQVVDGYTVDEVIKFIGKYI